MKPDKTNRHGFKISLTLHLILLVLALAAPWSCAIRAKPKPPEEMTFVQIPISVRTASLPDIPLPDAAIEEPSNPISIPEPVNEPLQKQETKKAEPAKKPKTVEKQTNRTTKAKASLELPKQPPPPSEEEIRDVLTSGMPAGDSSVLDGGESNPIFESYYNQVFSRMYAAWNQPAQLKTLPGLSTDVRITVEPGGKIIDRIKLKGAGNEMMDDSVMAAVRSVKELPPLPIGYRTPQEIIVTFVLGD